MTNTTKRKLTAGDWWIRDRNEKRFQIPLRLGLSEHMFEVIAKTHNLNKIEGKFPKSLLQLSHALGLSGTGKLYRKKSGKTGINPIECLALATILGVSVEDLVPDVQKWLETATIRMCKDSDVTLTQDEATEFVHYLLEYFEEYKDDGVRLSQLTIDDKCLDRIADHSSLDKVTLEKLIEFVLEIFEKCLSS